MKRKMVALLAAVMVLGSTATFVAAPSASANDVKTEMGKMSKELEY